MDSAGEPGVGESRWVDEKHLGCCGSGEARIAGSRCWMSVVQVSSYSIDSLKSSGRQKVQIVAVEKAGEFNLEAFRS